MNFDRSLIVVATLLTVSGTAAAQDFATGAESGSSDMVGPQGVRGRETRTQQPPQTETQSSEQTNEAEAEQPSSWFDFDRATGDWGGHRTKLEESGVTVEATFIGEWFSVVGGGVSSQSSARALFDVNVTLDLERMFKWEGASVFADFYWIDGPSLSADAGDFQGVSNIEADHRHQLSELWFEQLLFDDTIRVKLGKIEGNAEFAFVDAAGEFVNSSAGFSPTLLALPSYPDPSTGIILSWMPNEHFSITAGFMDGAATVDGVRTGLQGPDSFFNDDRSDDYVYLAEANFFWEGGRAGLGFWHHDGDFTRFLGGTESGTSGFYALAEHRIWNADDDRGIDIFAQLGFGDEAVNDVALHLAAGASWVGPWSSRPDDATGIYISFIDLSEDAGYTDDETVIELFYKLQLTPFMSIKPDVQYIIDPSGNSAIDDALVMGLRLETSF